MRYIVVIAAMMSLIGAVGFDGTRAACPSARIFTSSQGVPTSYVYTPGVCDTGYCTSGQTSVSADFLGAFWRLGLGNPSPGVVAGVDNGGFPALDGPDGGWVRYYPGYPAFIDSHWAADPRIHGCIDGSSGEPRCMAILLGDQLDATGYFALLTDAADTAMNYDFHYGVGDPLFRVRLNESGI